MPTNGHEPKPIDLTGYHLDYAGTTETMFAHREDIFETAKPSSTPRVMTKFVEWTQANLEPDED